MNEAVVVIGSDVEKQLFRGSDPLGQRIIVGNERYRVIGTLKEQARPSASRSTTWSSSRSTASATCSGPSATWPSSSPPTRTR
jgi:hypothetical protein